MSTRTVTVGLMADPGLPEAVAAALADGLCRSLSRHVDAEVQWATDVTRGTLPLTADGDIPLLERAQELRRDHGWDYVVYLTDLPRSHGEQSMLCELSSSARAALVSLPALGAWRLTARTRALLVTVVAALREGTADFASHPPARRGPGPAAVRRVPPSGTQDVSYMTLPGRLQRTRLLAGMVRNNRPGRLLHALSNCVAAAAATGAFGLFYTSIWSMADALHPVRLAMISVVVIAALSGWLILHNGLWVRSRHGSDRRRALLDNVATVVTVALSATLMYAVLYLVLLCGALAIIASGYLESQLGHPVTPLDHAKLTWLAASLGTMAGALGSNFDSDHAIREATYSRREHQRRQLDDIYEQ